MAAAIGAVATVATTAWAGAALSGHDHSSPASSHAPHRCINSWDERMLRGSESCRIKKEAASWRNVERRDANRVPGLSKNRLSPQKAGIATHSRCGTVPAAEVGVT